MISSLQMGPEFMRYELTDHEWFVIKPLLPIRAEAYRE
jgi:transposase